MQRLFSTFANGLPGKGLLVLRVVLAAYLVQSCLAGDGDLAGLPDIMTRIITGTTGMLILFGLWTPGTGALCAFVEVWVAVSRNGDPWAHILAASLGVGLALLGPGAHSVDARVFGRRRISL